MSDPPGRGFFEDLHNSLAMPLCEIDCGKKCGPFNDYGVPICCDIHQVIPAAFEEEWEYLHENTDLWMPWTNTGEFNQELEEELQDGQVLLECKGHYECQRDFRTLTCRAFPFYPYLNSRSEFLGMAYYPEFRFACWIISNLEVVSLSYKVAFQRTFQRLFEVLPEYHQKQADFSDFMRAKAAEENEQIILLTFSGDVLSIDPGTERENQVEFKELSTFGPFEITRELRFPDE
jgi:hypothetical protein